MILLNIIKLVKVHILEYFDEKITQFIGFFTSPKSPWIIVGIGAILRVLQFLHNRSLTEGEAPLAMNIVHRSYSELIQALDYIQPAPVGFSIIEKLFVEIFGNNEFALRLFPLIAGLVSLFLFLKLAKISISQKALPIALILFAVGDHLIYFSSEVKQYSSDVMITLLIILMACYILFKKINNIYLILFGLIGAISIWFSHPAIFTFFAASLVLLLSMIQMRQWENLVWLFICILITITSLTFNYFMSLAPLSKNIDLLEGFQRSFMPLSLNFLVVMKWLGYVFLRMFKSPLGLSIYELFLAVLSFFIGSILMFYKKRKKFLILILPIVLTLIASSFKKYPFEGRLLLFITPAMILIIAEGINFVGEKASQGSKIIGLSLVSILLIQPIILAGYHVIKSRAPEELKSVMGYLKEHRQQGDIICLYHATAKAFRYYSEKSGFTKNDSVVIIPEALNQWTNYFNALAEFKGNRRAWILFSHIVTSHGVDEEKLFLSYLDIIGTRLEVFKASGASIYLYDLRDKIR